MGENVKRKRKKIKRKRIDGTAASERSFLSLIQYSTSRIPRWRENEEKSGKARKNGKEDEKKSRIPPIFEW